MSAKTAIQALEDSELIHIFLDFVSTFKLQYEKQKKEISYKCFEATWSLLMAKATGYGRTENEAYKRSISEIYFITGLRLDIMLQWLFYKFFKRVIGSVTRWFNEK